MRAVQADDRVAPGAGQGFGVAFPHFPPICPTSRRSRRGSVHVGKNRQKRVFGRMSGSIDRIDDRDDPRRTVLEENSKCSLPNVRVRLHSATVLRRSLTKFKTNGAGCLCALSYHRSNLVTVMGMLIDIKWCGEFATLDLRHCSGLGPTQAEGAAR